MISEAEFQDFDEDLVLRVLGHARTIAPCLDSLEHGTRDYKTAVAILKGVITELPEPGSRRVRSMTRQGTSLTFDSVSSAFSAEDIRTLRSICGASAAIGLPQGSFPQDRVLDRLWPEERYS